MHFRTGVHDKGPQYIDNLVQFVPDLVLLNQGQDFVHHGYVLDAYLFALLRQVDHHFRLLTRGGSHLLRDVCNAFEIVTVGAIDQRRQQVGKVRSDPRHSCSQFDQS